MTDDLVVAVLGWASFLGIGFGLTCVGFMVYDIICDLRRLR